MLVDATILLKLTKILVRNPAYDFHVHQLNQHSNRSTMIKRILIRSLLGLLSIVLLLALFLLIILSIPTPQQLAQKAKEEALLILDVNIVDLEADSILKAQGILVENGRISRIAPSDSIQASNGIKTLEAKGKFVIPALWDMHTHYFSKYTPQFTMPLFVANGVTHIRDLGSGPSLEQKASWQEDILTRRLVGPRMASRASSIVYFIKDEAEAKKIVAEVKDPKDFIKTYNAILPDVYKIMAEEAKQRNIDFLGHKPRAISAIDAVKMGHKSMEHARMFLYESFPGAADLREEYRKAILGEREASGPIVGTEMMRRMVDEFDPEMFREIVEVMKEHNSWYVPTHVTRKMDAYADDEAYLNDPRLKYITYGQQYAWGEDTKGMVASDPSEAGRKAFMDFYEKGLELTAQGYALGLPILAGTDANDTYCIPGFALHDELEAMVAGGLSPREALITATLNPAKYYGWTDDFGTVSEGKLADLLLLDENPLEDIRHASRINALLFDGALYERSELDEMLDYVEENVSSLSMNLKLVKERLF